MSDRPATMNLQRLRERLQEEVNQKIADHRRSDIMQKRPWLNSRTVIGLLVITINFFAGEIPGLETLLTDTAAWIPGTVDLVGAWLVVLGVRDAKAPLGGALFSTSGYTSE